MKNKVKKQRKTNIFNVVVISILIITVSFLVYVLMKIYEQNQQIENLKISITKNNNSIKKYTEDKSNLIKRIESFEKNQKNNDNKIVYLNDQIIKLRTTQEKPFDADAKLLDLGFLINQASVYYALNKDQKITIKLLKLARQKIKEIKDLNLIDIEKSINKDLLLLNLNNQKDMTTDYIKLENVIATIDNWKPIEIIVNTTKIEPKHKKKKNESAWSHIKESINKTLKKWFKVTHHKNIVYPPISKKEIFNLKKIIKLKAEEANYALMRQNNSLYVQILTTIKKKVLKNFDQNTKTIQTVVNVINELIKNNIKPEQPMVLTTEQSWIKFKENITNEN